MSLSVDSQRCGGVGCFANSKYCCYPAVVINIFHSDFRLQLHISESWSQDFEKYWSSIFNAHRTRMYLLELLLKWTLLHTYLYSTSTYMYECYDQDSANEYFSWRSLITSILHQSVGAIRISTEFQNVLLQFYLCEYRNKYSKGLLVVAWRLLS